MKWSLDEQEWQAIANSRRQIEQSWRATAQLSSRNQMRSVKIDQAPVVRVSRRSGEPIGIQPWPANFPQQRFPARTTLPLKRPQVELPHFASRR